MKRIYLDNNSTTSLDPRAFKAMLLDLSGPPANPSSAHWFGKQARNLLLDARSTLASFFGVKAEEILFTSGGTEGINYLLNGLLRQGHVITTQIEHSAVYKTIESLKEKGLQVTYLPVGLWGAPLPRQVEEAIRPETCAIILTAANSETGVKIDLENIAQIAEKRQIPLIIDAVALIGKEPFILPPGVSGLALSAHKFHGPKGVGAVYVRSGLKLSPSLLGGNQENHKRAGTPNLSGILGMAEALRIFKESQDEITKKLIKLRDHFEKRILQEIPETAINGQGPRVSNTSNIAFDGVDGETLLIQLDLAGIAASHGSACSSGALEPSRILTHMGIPRKTARSSVRFSVGRLNTHEEIELAVERIAPIVAALRKL